MSTGWLEGLAGAMEVDGGTSDAAVPGVPSMEVDSGAQAPPTLSSMEIDGEPAPEPPKREQKCKKHSRCHCDLLSLETTDFFTIKV